MIQSTILYYRPPESSSNNVNLFPVGTPRFHHTPLIMLPACLLHVPTPTLLSSLPRLPTHPLSPTQDPFLPPHPLARSTAILWQDRAPPFHQHLHNSSRPLRLANSSLRHLHTFPLPLTNSRAFPPRLPLHPRSRLSTKRHTIRPPPPPRIRTIPTRLGHKNRPPPKTLDCESEDGSF